MGYGDELMASGMARGARARGKRVAFGNGSKIVWHRTAHEIFKGNPNVAPPGSEGAADLEWVDYYVGHRTYMTGTESKRWRYNTAFHPRPGQLYWDEAELRYASELRQPGDALMVVIEPKVPQKRQAINKRWPTERWFDVAHALRSKGYDVVELAAPGQEHPTVARARLLQTASFRLACAAMTRAALFIGAEGGLHHAAAAVEIPAVVLFGGFIHPGTTGYATHDNIFTGGEYCGSLFPCDHCRTAMEAITVERVVASAVNLLSGGKPNGPPAV